MINLIDVLRIDVREVPVNIVHNETLRNVISLPENFSVVHGALSEGNSSISRQHSKISQVYFILKGKGILYYGDDALKMNEDSYLVVYPKTPYKLKNVGKSSLEYLVISVPPFDPEDAKDIRILDDYNPYVIPKKFKKEKEERRRGLDGAFIHELMGIEEKEKLNIGLTIEFLSPGEKMFPHYHKDKGELYYIINESGKIWIENENFKLEEECAIYVPLGSVYTLENESNKEMKVLRVSPPHIEEDFYFEQKEG